MNTCNAYIEPHRDLLFLSPTEIEEILFLFNNEKNELFRQTALAVLNSGEKLEQSLAQSYPNFQIKVMPKDQGIQLYLEAAPVHAFVETSNGLEIIKGIGEHLYAVLRDLLFIYRSEKKPHRNISQEVFMQLRNAGMLNYKLKPNLVVCWGGHALLKPEYSYSKAVGYQLGVRRLDICTGSGAGAMQGPMKGAMIAHAKQRLTPNRYLGLTEPEIIAVEAPNPLVNQLVIMADIEKRLESFVRLAHGLIVFPGGIGTLEEILYIASILMHPKNKDIVFPLVFTGPESSRKHFELIDEFLLLAFGDNFKHRYQVVLEDHKQVAVLLQEGMSQVGLQRHQLQDANCYNWKLYIPSQLQEEFSCSHADMANLDLGLEQDAYILAANLRKALSGIVSANIRINGKAIMEQKGPYILKGNKELLNKLDQLIKRFIEDGRMKLDGGNREKYYKIQQV